MAVSAAHFAFSYLVFYLLDAVPEPGGIGYAKMLVVAYMVEFQNYYIRFPAIHAGVGLEVCIYIHTNAVSGYLAVLLGTGDNAFTMLRVVPAARFPLLFPVVKRHGWGV